MSYRYEAITGLNALRTSPAPKQFSSKKSSRDTDFAFSFEPADAGAVPGTRIDHDKGSAGGIDARPFGRDHARDQRPGSDFI